MGKYDGYSVWHAKQLAAAELGVDTFGTDCIGTAMQELVQHHDTTMILLAQ